MELFCHTFFKITENDKKSFHASRQKSESKHQMLLFCTTLLKTEVQNRGRKYAESTVLRWMHVLGFRYGKAKKGMFKDGHESPEVRKFGSFLNES